MVPKFWFYRGVARIFNRGHVEPSLLLRIIFALDKLFFLLFFAGPILSLVELSAKQVAKNIPFEAVERFHLPVPETLQLRIAYWSFPDNEEDVRLYSCLANGNVDEFHKGETLFRNKSVENLLQIGN